MSKESPSAWFISLPGVADRIIAGDSDEKDQPETRLLKLRSTYLSSKKGLHMLIIYFVLIALAAFPLILTIWRMRVASTIRKNGTAINAVITHITRMRTGKGGAMDILTLEYRDRATNQPHKGKATVSPGKYKIGDPMPVVYLPDKPDKYAIDTNNAYWAVLLFCSLLFLFVLFAVYKINEMVRSGQT